MQSKFFYWQETNKRPFENDADLPTPKMKKNFKKTGRHEGWTWAVSGTHNTECIPESLVLLLQETRICCTKFKQRNHTAQLLFFWHGLKVDKSTWGFSFYNSACEITEPKKLKKWERWQWLVATKARPWTCLAIPCSSLIVSFIAMNILHKRIVV